MLTSETSFSIERTLDFHPWESAKCPTETLKRVVREAAIGHPFKASDGTHAGRPFRPFGNLINGAYSDINEVIVFIMLL